FYYYLPVLLAGFLPWSAFLGPAVWHSVRVVRAGEGPDESGVRPRDRHLYLWCWAAVYFLAFSLCRTKLPNYILPLYAPVAILTAAALDGWRRGAANLPGWAAAAALGCLAAVGLGVVAAGLLVGGVLPGEHLVRGGPYAGMEARAVLGLLPA